MAPRPGVLIFNPVSGKGRSAGRAEDFAAAWKGRFTAPLRMRPSRSPSDLRAAAAETLATGERPIFLGGDGTFSEALQGLAEANGFRPLTTAAGLLPAGTGNSFLRDFGLTTFEAAADRLFAAIEGEQEIPVDLAFVDYTPSEDGRPPATPTPTPIRRIMFNLWGIGIVSDINAAAVRMRRLGSFAYTLAAVYKVFGHRPFMLHAEIDGAEWSGECNFLTLSNSQYTGGAMRIAPQAQVNDGRMFMVRPSVRGVVRILRLFPSVFSGAHLTDPRVASVFVERVRILDPGPWRMLLDGELIWGQSPEITIQPSYWRLCLPPA